MLGFWALGEQALGGANIVPPTPDTGADTHDAPPPSFLAWARKEKAKVLARARTEREAADKLKAVAHVVSQSAPSAEKAEVGAVLEVLELPEPDLGWLMLNLERVELLLALYARIRQEQNVLLLLLED